MKDAVTTCQTVLLIRLGTPAVSTLSVSGVQPARSAERLRLVEAALGNCEMIRLTRIGDTALIGVFSAADSAFGAACSVNQVCREFDQDSAPADVRILICRSTGDFADDDAPDHLHTLCAKAEQLIDKVPAGQVCATRDATGLLGELSSTRIQLSEQPMASADLETELCQVICNDETVTRIAVPTRHQEKSVSNSSLNLRWRENILTLAPESPPLTIGRGDQSDIQIESELVSRIHAHVGFQQTNFVLTDQSTNGTFVQIDDDEEVYLHHEQIVLRGRGVIGLGRHIRAGKGKLIYFKLAT